MKMSKRTLYKLFPSKVWLFRVCLSDFANKIRASVQQKQIRMDSSCMGHLFPEVDTDRFAAELREAIYQSCLQGTPHIVQWMLNYMLLRGLFKMDGIRYIDEHLAFDKLNVCV